VSANSFELFVAGRYLRAKRKQAVISVITVISIAGVAAGVMALVIAIAINNGFRSTLQRSLLGATAHIMIQEKPDEESTGIENWKQIEPQLRKLPHVINVAADLYGYGLVSGPLGGLSSGAEIKGVPLDTPPDILLHLQEGSFSALRNQGAIPGIILGSRLAQSTGMRLGAVANVLSPQGTLTPLYGMIPKQIRFRVVGIFESGFYEIDSLYAFTSLDSAEVLFGVESVNRIELKLNDIYKAPEVAVAAQKIIGPKLVAYTWMEQYQQILGALSSEKTVTAVTIGLIELVAALNILITLVMMVMEKNRDIAMLMSMGARRQQIRNIFIFQGVLIGLVGTVIGLILGYSLSYLADHYHWLSLNQEVYSFSYVPFNPRLVDGIWIAAVAIATSFIATLYPARSATRVAPVEALRYE
jgi:lipoprotein-releasing system permease protein